MLCLCQIFFLHKGNSKYTGSCDLNRMIFSGPKNHSIEIIIKISDLNWPTPVSVVVWSTYGTVCHSTLLKHLTVIYLRLAWMDSGPIKTVNTYGTIT